MLTNSDINDGDLNPKVQIELEKLNTASAQINDFENKLQELRNNFYETLSKCSSSISEISNKVGSAIPRARPYYELKKSQIEVQRESQAAASRYETACFELNHANTVVAKSESLARESNKLDDSAMEILNIAIAKVNLAKKEKTDAHMEHQKYLSMYIDIDTKIHQQERRHKNDIKKSMDYFLFTKFMEEKLKEDKLSIETYEEKIRICKSIYNDSLQRLEEISNHIHNERQKKDFLGPRGEGVGAEVGEPFFNKEEHVTLEHRQQSPVKEHQDVSENDSSLSTSTSTYRRITAYPVRRRTTLASSTPIVDGLLKAALDNQMGFLYPNMYSTLPRDFPLSQRRTAAKSSPGDRSGAMSVDGRGDFS